MTQIKRTALVWPDNVPLYSPTSQMDFFLKPTTEFKDMDQLVQAVKDSNEEQVRVAAAQ